MECIDGHNCLFGDCQAYPDEPRRCDTAIKGLAAAFSALEIKIDDIKERDENDRLLVSIAKRLGVDAGVLRSKVDEEMGRSRDLDQDEG